MLIRGGLRHKQVVLRAGEVLRQDSGGAEARQEPRQRTAGNSRLLQQPREHRVLPQEQDHVTATAATTCHYYLTINLNHLPAFVVYGLSLYLIAISFNAKSINSFLSIVLYFYINNSIVVYSYSFFKS